MSVNNRTTASVRVFNRSENCPGGIACKNRADWRCWHFITRCWSVTPNFFAHIVPQLRYLLFPRYAIYDLLIRAKVEGWNMLLIGGMTARLLVLKNGVNALLLKGCRRLEAMQQRRLEGTVRWIQQHFKVLSVVENDEFSFKEAERLRSSMVVNNIAGILRLESKFVNVINTILNVFIAFENDYTTMFIATRIADRVKDMMGSEFLMKLSP